ncbi:MAG: 16S rRNA (guanine(527)-N(7))-methyltransferase RsmG [Planctomycetota bacterium]
MVTAATLRRFLGDCGVVPERLERLDVLERLFADLRAANERANLTRLTDAESFWNQHVADSLLVGRVCREVLVQALTLADVGCGAGFPLLPLAWANPRLTVVGIEPRRKRAAFVAAEAEALGLDNVSVVALQAREAARREAHRHACDIVCLRAVGAAGRLIRDCRNLLRPTTGAKLIFYKTPDGAASELPAARREAAKYDLAARLSPVLSLPDGQARQFIVLER